jgi:hypothetical protein
MGKPNKGQTKKKQTQERSFLDTINRFFNKNQKSILIVSAVLTIVFSFLLFNFNVSLMGDDGAYIKRAYRIVEKGDYPTFQGPIYPFILSFFIWIFGLNITLLKALSGAFIIGHLFFFYKAFKDRVPSIIYLFTIIIIGTNAYLLNYSSWTYSEALFLLFQALIFYYFFRYILDNEFSNIKEKISKFLILGLLLFLLAKTRSVGYAGIGAIILFFAFNGKFKDIGYTLGSFGLFYFILKGIKGFFFGISSSHQFGQLNRLLAENPYKPNGKQENLIGFIERFWGNSELYLSKHVYKFLGLRPDVLDTSTILTIITYAIFALALYYAFRKNKYLLFTGIYIAVMCGVTFLILQTRWDQPRLILVFFPLILLFLLSGIYYLGKAKNNAIIKALLPTLIIVLTLTNLGRTFKKVEAHQDKFIHHIQGDDLYGLSPDWVNYIKMCRYAAKNVPDSVTIACRKPPIAFIKTKREFHGIYRVLTKDPDELLNKLKRKNVKYVIMASLRKYPNKKTKYTINTVKRYLYYIKQKYPRAIRAVHKIGQDEEAYLFRINYSVMNAKNQAN